MRRKCPKPRLLVATLVDKLAQIVVKNRRQVKTYKLIEEF